MQVDIVRMLLKVRSDRLSDDQLGTAEADPLFQTDRSAHTPLHGACKGGSALCV